MEKLQWRAGEFPYSQHSDTEVEQKTIAGILWGLHAGDRTSRFDEFRGDFASGRYPQVQALLPSNFNSLTVPEALAQLRRHLDPNEWCVSSWYTQVYAAEEWIDTASQLSLGRQHMVVARLTLERVSKAHALLAQGASQKAVAAQLKISPPYLSRLLKRYPFG